LRVAGFHEFAGSEILTYTSKEIKAALTAIRMRANDYSITAAIGCFLYLSANSDPENGPMISGYSKFLPYPQEYESQISQNSQNFNISRETAQMILDNYHLLASANVAVISVHIDEIRQIAK
jgi:hypothetical protein